MVKENVLLQMELNMMVNGQMIKKMVKENTLTQMEIYMMVNG
jgi:hypothetical protein